MDKKSTIASITVPSILAVGLFVLGGVTVGQTHSLNPMNMKIRSEFKSLKIDDQTRVSEDYKQLKEFVDNNGKGTLILLKDGHYKFETVESRTQKNQIDCKDWEAVKKYNKAQKKAQQSVKNDVHKTVPIKPINQIDKKVQKKPSEQLRSLEPNDYLKGVLDKFNLTTDEFDKILHVFWLAKEKYTASDISSYAIPIEGFKPKGRPKKAIFLKAISEENMRELIYSYDANEWKAWGKPVSDSLDEDSQRNPVVSCRDWADIDDNSANNLAAQTGHTKSEVINYLRTFRNIFYTLSGVPMPPGAHHYQDSTSLPRVNGYLVTPYPN